MGQHTAPKSILLQVGIYVKTSIFTKFHFSMDHDLFQHDNILSLLITHPPTNKSALLVNLYDNPNRDALSCQRGTTCTLL